MVRPAVTSSLRFNTVHGLLGHLELSHSAVDALLGDECA